MRQQQIIKPKTQTRTLGTYVVVDPEICHGQPTFKGTRILVKGVLEQVASGMSWDDILKEWRGTLPREAIAEAVRLASKALLTQTEELVGNLVDV